MSCQLYGWLSTDPPVLIHSLGDDIGHHLFDRPVIRFVTQMWHATVESIAGWHSDAVRRRPDDVIHHLANDPLLTRDLICRGIPATQVNSNAWVDERLFVPDELPARSFDAVYNARMVPFKRHWLAEHIRTPLFIGGIFADDDRNEYLLEQKQRMPHAEFVHGTNNRFLPSHEVAGLLNRAHVGLCLSALEGAMFAAIEYLLCGLPVVSTVNCGGRDVWFDPQYARTVPADPTLIAAAVSELIELRLSPTLIRNQTLCRIWDHRRRFLDLGQTIYSARGVGREFARDFYSNFTNKLGDWRPAEAVMHWYEECRVRTISTR